LQRADGAPAGLCGFEAGIAGDGRAALDMLDGFEPNLVLLDLAMPGMDGLIFCGPCGDSQAD